MDILLDQPALLFLFAMGGVVGFWALLQSMRKLGQRRRAAG